MIDKALLRYEAERRHLSTTDMCEKLGISRGSYSAKLNGRAEFTLPEVRILVSLFGFDSICRIFFGEKVS